MTDPVKSKAESREPIVGPGEREFEELTRITNDLVTAQRQLQKQQAALCRLNDEKNLALGIVAHDLRNPLALIEMQSEFLLGGSAGFLSPAQRELLESIAQQGCLMLSIVNDLLDISAIDAGRFELNIVRTSVSALVEGSVRRNSLLAAEKLVSISYQSPDRNCDAAVDSHKFEQVLNNLIGNAVKYAPCGSGVEVTLISADDYFELHVRDHGPGISDEKRDTLFSPFTTGGVAPSAGEKSTGLGLAIVQRIVESHGGTITVDSKVNHGSCFSVRMPRQVNVAASAAKSTDSSSDQKSLGKKGASSAVGRVLIVDDNVGAAKMTGRMLKSFCNAMIEFAHDGQSAMDAVTSFQPDVVLLDIELPVFSGIEVARRLHQRFGENSPYVCAISAHREGDVDELGGRKSFDEILTKPTSIDQLQEMFENLQDRWARSQKE